MSNNLFDKKIIYACPPELLEDRPEARSHFYYILQDVADIRTRYIRLGFHLREFERFEYFKDFGYSSLADFCEVNLSLDKSALSRCLAVYNAFSSVNDGVEYRNGVKVSPNYMTIGKKWEGFSYSQLCEMVSMSEDLRDQVNPNMTITQIRDLKRQNRETSIPPSDVSRVAMSQQFLEDVAPISSGAELKRFKFGKYFSLHGAALSTYIKHLDSSGSVRLFVFDEFGAPLFVDASFDLLYTCDDIDGCDTCFVFRACPSTVDLSELETLCNANGQP